MQEPSPAISRAVGPAISIVIPVLNCAGVIGAQLESLAHESVDGGFEVVVSDNGSTDGTREVALGFADRLDIRIVDASARSRAAFARNTGAEASHAPLILFLDADDEVAPGYVAAMTAALGSARIVGARLDVAALNGGRPLARDIAQAEALPVGLYPWSYSCALGVHRDLFLRIGGFEEQLWNGEDNDFCWRANLAGAPIEFVPDAVLRYRVPDDPATLFRQGRNYGRGGSQVERRFAAYRTDRWPSDDRRRLDRLLRQILTLSARLAVSRSHLQRARYAFLLGRRIGYLTDRIRPLPIRGVLPDGRPAD